MNRKRIIFLSMIAMTAIMSCSKSEVIDTKFSNDEITFDTYLGRDAQTKASVATTTSIQKPKGQGIGIYGFYTGASSWTGTESANLLLNENLYYSGGWKYDAGAYWVNEKDNYTFFAYYPYGNSSVVASQQSGKAPQIVYTVPEEVVDQVDLIYSDENVNVSKEECTKTVTVDGTTTKVTEVPFIFKHALSRVSVKANAVMYDKATGKAVTFGQNDVASEPLRNNYEHIFTIQDITISGLFNTTGTFTFYDLTEKKSMWASATPTQVEYTLVEGGTSQDLTNKLYDFSKEQDFYMMMIPTDFSKKSGNAYVKSATLSVTYTIDYAGVVSAPITKTLTLNTNFEQGKAYSINLTFQRDESNAIVFTVDEENFGGWGSDTTITPDIF